MSKELCACGYFIIDRWRPRIILCITGCKITSTRTTIAGGFFAATGAGRPGYHYSDRKLSKYKSRNGESYKEFET